CHEIPGDGRGECNEHGAKRTEEIHTSCPEISVKLSKGVLITKKKRISPQVLQR
ncbi:hypothetical protein M404DRAFT_1005113, partial [Pisolithus tinctorius Marx 270]